MRSGGQIALRVGQNKTGNGFPFPVVVTASGQKLKLVHLIELNAVAGVNVFHREDDHASGRGGCHSDNDDLTDGAARPTTW